MTKEQFRELLTRYTDACEYRGKVYDRPNTSPLAEADDAVLKLRQEIMDAYEQAFKLGMVSSFEAGYVMGTEHGRGLWSVSELKAP